MNFHQPSRCPRHSSGFSLIEIMLSVTLLTIILLGLLAMFFQVQRAFRAGTTQADILEGGRATMALIVRDLQEMAPSEFAFVTNCTIAPAGGLNFTTQALPTGWVRTNRMEDIGFLSRRGDEWFGTAYRVAYSSNGVGILHRFSTNGFRDTLPWRTSNVLAGIVSEVAGLDPEVSPSFHPVLDGVVSLTFTPFHTNGIAYSNTYTVLPRQEANGRVINYERQDFEFLADRVPAYIEVELAVVEPNILARFRARDADVPGRQAALEYLNRQIGKTHLFRQRVAIRAAATDLGSLR